MRTTLFIAVLILNALSAGFVSAQTKQIAPGCPYNIHLAAAR